MAKIMAEKGSFAGFATHDQELIDELLNWIRAENISKDKFEFQALYGVPMDGRLERLIDYGYSVRIYVPFGPDWFDYSIRRLEENPNIAKYVLKNFFKMADNKILHILNMKSIAIVGVSKNYINPAIKFFGT